MNKPKHPAFLLLTMVSLFLSAVIADARPWPQDGSDLPVDAAVEWGHLENGIRYVILPWNEPPERVSLRLLIEAGSVHESDRQKGLAHVIEHMAFNGTRHYSAGEMVEYFQRLGMDFGADTNAHTWWRETVYKLELPSNEEALLRDGLQLLRDYADGMLFEPEELEKERGVVLSEYRDGKSADFLAYLDGLKFALPDSRISERITIGDADVITMATRQDLVDYYEKWYVPERMVLIAVGEVEPDGIAGLFREYFADMQPSAMAPEDPDMGTIQPAGVKTRLFSHPELAMGNAEIYARKKIEPRVQMLDHLREELLMDLANAALSRRFEKLSKEEDAPITRGQGYGYRWLDFVEYGGVSVYFEPVNMEAALEMATRELNRAIRYGFTQAEMEEAKANVINALEEGAARKATRKSRDLSSALVRSVRDGQVFIDPVARRDLLLPVVQSMTPEAVSTHFANWWSTGERMINITGNFDSLVAISYDTANQIAVEPPVEDEIKPWAYADLGEAGNVVKSNYIEDLGVRQLVLSNGVRLNLKQTDYEANKVHVKASFGNGKLEAPMDKPGLPLMASAIFTAGGLGEHSNDDIQALTAGRTVGAGFAVSDNEFTLGGVTNEEDLDLQLQLLAAYLKDPGFRPEGERLLRRQLDALYNQLAHDPSAVMQNEVARFLAGNDPRFGYPERADLESRTTGEVAAWMKDALSSGYLELSVVGDFKDPDAVVNSVLRTFGALPQRSDDRPSMESARQVEFPRGSGGRDFTYVSEIPRAMAVVNWPTRDQSDIFEVRRLSVLGSVYSDLLRIKIREGIGEAYSPYAYNSSSDTYDGYGIFRAVVGVKPEMVETIEGMLLDIGSELAESGIDEDALVRAIEPIKTQIEEYRRTNGYWLNSVLLRSQDEPVRLDWARSFEGFWETVTVEQINELAQRYLQPADGVPTRIRPQS